MGLRQTRVCWDGERGYSLGRISLLLEREGERGLAPLGLGLEEGLGLGLGLLLGLLLGLGPNELIGVHWGEQMPPLQAGHVARVCKGSHRLGKDGRGVEEDGHWQKAFM